jgi:hypothetical protein
VSVDAATSTVDLDDGTGIGRILLSGDAASYIALLAPGDALNATGRATMTPDSARLVVSSAADIVRVDDLGTAGQATAAPQADAGSAASSLTPSVGEREDGPGSRSAALGGLPIPDPTTSAGFASIVLISLASLAVTLARRWRSRRLATARIAARLASIATPTGVVEGPSSGPEHGPDRSARTAP